MKHYLPSALGVFLFVAVLTLATTTAWAEVRLPEIFGSDMVLQRDREIPFWGWAEPGEDVSVALAGGGQTQNASVKTGDSGKWLVTLKPLKAGGPLTVTVKGKNTITLANVLVGDVWICSGQSNMEWRMQWLADAKDDTAKANNPNIRFFQVEKEWAQSPQESLKAKWTPCTPETTKDFSAVAYYFGRRLQSELDIPIGLINTSWGGTRIEPWTPPFGFKNVPALDGIAREIDAKDPTTSAHKELVAKTLDEYKTWIKESEANLAASKTLVPPPNYPGLLAPFGGNQSPTVLYNKMVHPMIPLAFKGAIWYQGESNLGEGMLYAEKMRALIEGWRKVFDNPEMSFYFVQLAPFDYGGDALRLPLIWEAQAYVEKTIPNTGMAVINDIGNLKDIHPAHKDQVGKRLADLALKRTYGKTDLPANFPEMQGELNTVGNTLVVVFANAKTLKTRDDKAPDWFEIAGRDGSYRKADARIEGNTVILSHPGIDKPYAMRFAWDMLAEPNLCNEAGLPVSAFRAGEIPQRGLLDTFVPDAKNFKLLYSFDPTQPRLADNNHRFVYTTDKSSEPMGKVKRVGYFLYLKPKQGEPQYVFVTMPPLSESVKQLGVPVKSIGARFQKKVPDVTVVSNVESLATGTFTEGCNVEFWDCNYAHKNAIGLPGAADAHYDFDDTQATNNSPGYGSMQIHSFAKKQVILAFNNFGAGPNCDVGIGNCPRGDNPDWTFSASAKDYEAAQFLILVETE